MRDAFTAARRHRQGVEVRQDFRPLVFWLGSATTDADGRATTTVTLPDSLTTYRIMAVAGDQASQLRIRRARDPRHEAADAAAGVPALPEQGRPRVVRRRRHERRQGRRRRRRHDSEPRSGSAAVRRRRDADGPPRAGRVASPVKFDAVATRRRQRARADDRDARRRDRRVRDAAARQRRRCGRRRPRRTATRRARATERIALPPGVLPGAGGLTVELASTALVGLGESARYLDEYPYECAEQKASRALALLLASDLGGAFTLSGIKPGRYRAAGRRALNELYGYQCADGGFSLWPGAVRHRVRLPHRVRPPRDEGRRHAARSRSIASAVEARAGLSGTELQAAAAGGRSGGPSGRASQAFAVKVLAEFGRKPAADIDAARRAGRSPADLRAVLPGRRACRLQRSRSALSGRRPASDERAPHRRRSRARRGNRRRRARVAVEHERARDGRRARRPLAAQGRRDARGAARALARSRRARTAGGARRTRTRWRSRRSSPTTARSRAACRR